MKGAIGVGGGIKSFDANEILPQTEKFVFIFQVFFLLVLSLFNVIYLEPYIITSEKN